jgi:hypothetical protein
MTILKSLNGEIVEMTAEEETAFLQQQQEMQTATAERQAKEQAEKDAKASGNQKLLDLGLTQAEATALTGYTPPVEV